MLIMTMSWVYKTRNVQRILHDFEGMPWNPNPAGEMVTDAPLPNTTLSHFVNQRLKNTQAKRVFELACDEDDCTIDMALFSPITQVPEDPANRRQVYHFPDEGLSSDQSSSVGRTTEWPLVEQIDSLISIVRENPRQSSENEKIKILVERQGSKFSLILKQRISNYEL